MVAVYIGGVVLIVIVNPPHQLGAVKTVGAVPVAIPLKGGLACYAEPVLRRVKSGSLAGPGAHVLHLGVLDAIATPVIPGQRPEGNTTSVPGATNAPAGVRIISMAAPGIDARMRPSHGVLVVEAVLDAPVGPGIPEYDVPNPVYQALVVVGVRLLLL